MSGVFSINDQVLVQHGGESGNAVDVTTDEEIILLPEEADCEGTAEDSVVMYKCEDCNSLFTSWEHVQSHLHGNRCSNSIPQRDVQSNGILVQESEAEDFDSGSLYIMEEDGSTNVLQPGVASYTVNDALRIIDASGEQTNVLSVVDRNALSVGESMLLNLQHPVSVQPRNKLIEGSIPADLSDWIVRHDKPGKRFSLKPISPNPTPKKRRGRPRKNNLPPVVVYPDPVPGLAQCNFCGAMFKTAAGLDAHEKIHQKQSEIACDVCSMPFGSIRDLKAHREVHTGKPKAAVNICDVCGEEFMNTLELSHHMADRHREELAYYCGYCHSSFMTRDEQRAHHAICETKAKRSARLDRRKRRRLVQQEEEANKEQVATPEPEVREDQEDDEAQFSCGLCSSTFSLIGELSEHVTKFHELEDENPALDEEVNGKMSCFLCYDVFDDIDALQQHECKVLTAGLEIASFACQICGDLFMNQLFYELHVQKHEAECTDSTKDVKEEPEVDVKPELEIDEKPELGHGDGSDSVAFENLEYHYYCRRCGKMFTDPELLTTHLQTHVAKQQDESLGDGDLLSCEVCDKKFKSEAILNQHSLTHMDPADLPYKCTLCPKAFTRRNLLQYHLNTHTGQTPYKCQTCSACFASAHELRTHERKEHEGFIKPKYTPKNTEWPCSQCGKILKTKESLQVHTRIHTGEKPYQCTICERAFKRRSEIRQHLHTHTGVRPYECDICGDRFRYLNNLTSHRMIHSDERPYTCEYCGKAFRKKANLDKHILAQHTKHAVQSPKPCSMEMHGASDEGQQTDVGQIVMQGEAAAEGQGLGEVFATHAGDVDIQQ